MSSPATRTLAGALDRPGNAFNALRLGAAAMVVISHSYFILGGGNAAEPFSWSAYDLGAMAVNVFFVLSGVMICRSLENNPDLWRYARARVLRIYPGLFFAAFLTMLLIGPVGSNVPLTQYFTDSATWLYPVQVLWDFAGASLPLFDHGQHEANASLWTIKFELLAYLGCLILAFLGLAHNRLIWLAIFVTAGILIASGLGVEGESANAFANLFRFTFAFAFGALAYQMRHRLILNVPLGVMMAIVALLVNPPGVGSVLCILTTGYAALSIGGCLAPGALAWTQGTDISFGLYLFGWPVQQALVHWFAWTPQLVGLHIVLSFAIVLPLAWLSWRLIEKPALALRG
ncbi:MAG: hypothetical protein ABS75_32535 [Pelagibacterium sp. SCN 63-23]|nr:MAG: hypothetical protein ABS75_32535 [Pelagibacterium sp. SCN 63-23]